MKLAYLNERREEEGPAIYDDVAGAYHVDEGAIGIEMSIDIGSHCLRKSSL